MTDLTDYQIKVAQTDAQRQRKHRANKPPGICLTCPEPSDGRTCPACRKKAAERVKASRARKQGEIKP